MNKWNRISAVNLTTNLEINEETLAIGIDWN